MVAIQIMKASKANNYASTKLLKIASTLQQLDHNNLQKMYSVEQDNDNHYLVLEKINAESLAVWLKKDSSFSTDWVLTTIYQVLQAVYAGHEIGIIHQGIHPQNIFLQNNGHVKIMLFGLNLTKGQTGFEPGSHSSENEKLYIIKEDEVHYFWSPELYKGEKVCERSDIYSVGILFYYLLTNSYPFCQTDGIAYLNQSLNSEPTEITKYIPDIDQRLQAMIMKMIAPDKNKRYQNVPDVIADLEAMLNSKTKKRILFSKTNLNISPAKIKELANKVIQDKSAVIILLSLAYQNTNYLSQIQKHIFRLLKNKKNHEHIEYLLFVYNKITLRGLKKPSMLKQGIYKIKSLLQNSNIPDHETEKFIEQSIMQNSNLIESLSDKHEELATYDVTFDSRKAHLEKKSESLQKIDRVNEQQNEQKLDVTAKKSDNIQEKSVGQKLGNKNEKPITFTSNAIKSLTDKPGKHEELVTYDITFDSRKAHLEKKSESLQKIDRVNEQQNEQKLDVTVKKSDNIQEKSVEQKLGNKNEKPITFTNNTMEQVERKQLLGEILIELKIITQGQLQKALVFQRKQEIKIGEVLIDLGFITEVELYQTLARQFSIPFVDVSEGEIPAEIIECIPIQVVEERLVVPVKKIDHYLVVAIIDPLDLVTIEDLRFLLACEIKMVITTPSAMKKARKKYYDCDILIDAYSQLTVADIEYGTDEPDSYNLDEKRKPKLRKSVLVSDEEEKKIEPKKPVLVSDEEPVLIEDSINVREQHRLEQSKKTSGLPTQKTWQNWLGEDAGIPGPIERLVAQSKILMKTMQVTFGMYFVLFANAIDMLIDIVSGYVRRIFNTWKMARTIKRAIRRRDPNILTSELQQDYTKARVFLYRLLYNSSSIKQQIEKLDIDYTRDIVLKLVLELRDHLNQMRYDLDFINQKEIAETAKKNIKDVLFSFIPNPLSVFIPIKDFLILLFAMDYSRKEINNFHHSLLIGYQQLICYIENEYQLNKNEVELLLCHEQNIYSQLQKKQQDIDKIISNLRETLRGMLWALCKAEIFFNPQKWSLDELVLEVKHRKEDCDPLLILDLEIRLTQKLFDTFNKLGTKFDLDEKQLQMSERRALLHSLRLQKKITKMFM